MRSSRQRRLATDAQPPIRLASAADAPAFGRLLHAFNAEFGESTPDADVIAERAAPLIESGEATVLFAGDGPYAFAELRFRPLLYPGALDAHLEELYVAPERRGHGLGRALLEAAMDHARGRGAKHIDLGSPAGKGPGRSSSVSAWRRPDDRAPVAELWRRKARSAYRRSSTHD